MSNKESRKKENYRPILLKSIDAKRKEKKRKLQANFTQDTKQGKNIETLKILSHFSALNPAVLKK